MFFSKLLWHDTLRFYARFSSSHGMMPCCMLINPVPSSMMGSFLKSFNGQYLHSPCPFSYSQPAYPNFTDLRWLSLDHLSQFSLLTWFFPGYQPWPTNSHCNKLGWFFLSRRACHVNVNGTLPQSAEAITGVPQCAFIGSLLFGIYVNGLPDRLSGIYHGAHVHLHMTARQSSTKRVVMPTCGHGAPFW